MGSQKHNNTEIAQKYLWQTSEAASGTPSEVASDKPWKYPLTALEIAFTSPWKSPLETKTLEVTPGRP